MLVIFVVEYSSPCEPEGRGENSLLCRPNAYSFLVNAPPRSKQASKRTLPGIMDDAVDSLRENDSYGSLARFVEVDRRRLRISGSEARSREGFRYTAIQKKNQIYQVSRFCVTPRDDPLRTDLPPNRARRRRRGRRSILMMLLMNLTFQTSLEPALPSGSASRCRTPASALLTPFFFTFRSQPRTRDPRESFPRSAFSRGALTGVSRASKSLAFLSEPFSKQNAHEKKGKEIEQKKKKNSNSGAKGKKSASGAT